MFVYYVAKAGDGARGTTRTRNGKQRRLKLSPMSLSKHVNISSQDGGIFYPMSQWLWTFLQRAKLPDRTQKQ